MGKTKEEKAADKKRPIRVTVELTEDEFARLDGAADRQGISRSDVVRRAVNEYPMPVAQGVKRGA